MAVGFLLVDRIYHIGKNNCKVHIEPQLFQSEVKVNIQHWVLEIREPLGTGDLGGTEQMEVG